MPLFPRRYLRFMAKSELYWWPLGPLITARAARFPVRRGERDIEAMDTAVELAREGTCRRDVPARDAAAERAREEGTSRKSHTGAARIALEAGVPLVPAAIAGTDRLSRLGPLRVRYGKPIPLDDLRRTIRRPPRARRPSG